MDLPIFVSLAWLAASPGLSSPSPLTTPVEDIRNIAGPLPYFLRGGVLWLVIAAVSLLLAGAVAWYLLRRPRNPKQSGPILTAREAARQRLAELEARLDEIEARAFGGELSEVLRAYIAAEYRLNPQRQTSPEFLASAAASHIFSQHEQTLAEEFLDGCDLLKFARLDATAAGKRALLAQAREFVDGVAREPQAPPLPPTEPPPFPSTPGAHTDDEKRWAPPETVAGG